MVTRKLSGLIVFLLVFTLLMSMAAVADWEHANLEHSAIYGMVDYSETIESDYDESTLQSAISVGFHTISVDDETYPELNAPATLTFNSVYYDEPMLLRNGYWVQDTELTNTGYGTWEVEVDGFSTYSIVETDFSYGTFEETTLADIGQGTGIVLAGDAELIVNFEGGTAIDSSYNGYTLTEFGTDYTIDSELGIDFTGGLEFDDNASNEGVQVNNNNDPYIIDNGSSFSINSWVKTRNKAALQGIYTGSHDASASYWPYGLYITGNYVRCLIGNGTDTVLLAEEINNDEWTHYTCQYDNSTQNLYLYKNGIQESTSSVTLGGIFPARTTVAGNTMELIGSGYGAGISLNGTMDNIMVFDRKLSQQEILKLYYSNQKVSGIIQQNLGLEVGYNFNNGSAVDILTQANDATLLGGSFETTGGHDETTYFFNNNQTGLETINNIDFSQFTEFTVSTWLKFEPTADSTYQRILGQESGVSPNQRTFMILTASQTVSPYSMYSTIYDDTNSPHSSSFNFISAGAWVHYVTVFNGTTIQTYVDNVRKADGATDVPSIQENTINKKLTIGNTDRGISQFSGSIDSIYVFSTALDSDQVEMLYSGSGPIFKNVLEGDYTSRIISATEAVAAPNITAWSYSEIIDYNLQKDENSSELFSLSKMYQRASDDNVTLLAQPWQEFIFNGTHYIPSSIIPIGNYAQYRFELEDESGIGVLTDNIIEVTLSELIYVTPEVFNATISTTLTPESSENIDGVSTAILNDVESLQVTHDWYVNGVFAYASTSGEIFNGTVYTSTLNSYDTTTSDLVNFTAITCHFANPSICSEPVWSDNTAVVQNSNFTYTYTPDNNETIDITKPRKRVFRVDVTDPDGDVNVYWYKDGTSIIGTGERLELIPNDYDDYEIFDLTVNLTDGAIEQTTTWEVQILPPEVQAVAGIAVVMFIMAVTGLFVFLPFFFNRLSASPITSMILKRASWLISMFLIMFNASIVANIAEAAGLSLNNELFRYMWLAGWVGYAFMIFFVLKSLFDVLKLWREIVTKNRMGGDYDDEI